LNNGQLVGGGNVNRHLRDFLDFEDSDHNVTHREEEPIITQKMLHTTTLPKPAKKDLSDGRPKVASMDHEQISEMIAGIDYNVSQEGMSASFYRIKERQEQSPISRFEIRPGAES
jgi:hypothetical protein